MNSPWEHFSLEELTCKCGCGQMKMQDSFMDKLVKARKYCRFPFVVTSAYRCPEYNNEISSTGREGPHTTGRAVDIACTGSRFLEILDAAYIHEIIVPDDTDTKPRGGLGVKQHGKHQSRFIHLDDLSNDETSGPRPWCWSYK